MEYGSRPATDLIYNGKALLPDEAHQMVLESSGKFDLSLLDPDTTSELWKNTPPVPLKEESGVDIEREGGKLSYLGIVPSRSGNFRFTVEQEDESGQKRILTVMLNKSVHNVLLRKNLLRKLGYNVPAIKYLKNVNLKFSNQMEKEIFVSNLAESTFGDPKRWIPDVEKEGFDGSDEAKLQDVIIMDSQDHIYNLGIGFIPSQVIQGRRILNSLIIPYALVEVPESVNLMPWSVGRVINKQLRVEYESAGEFSCTYNDAKWIIRRIAKLTRSDFAEIVHKAGYPREVELLLIEKLISRRNNLVKLFKIDAKKIKIDSKISYGELLKKGKLYQEYWEGHASRYAYGDPESPLSKSEMFALFKSKGISNILSNLVGQVNKHLPKMQLEKALIERQKELIHEQIEDAINNGGVMKPVPFGIWAYPIVGGNLIASRDVVAGSYMGTDNKVQLVDTVGLSMNAGAFMYVEGVKAPWAVSGKVLGFFTRTYSHLRPITSFKAAVKYPFKNILVPMFKRKMGNFFNELISNKLKELPEEERLKKIEEVMGHFKDELTVGESLIVTDTAGVGLNVTAGASWYRVLKAQASFGANQVILSRLHIYRKDENTIQIYRDLGNYRSLILSFQFKAVVPILSVSVKWTEGAVRCKFYTLNINSNEKENPDFMKNLLALKSVLVNNSLELTKTVNKPYVLKHKFKEVERKGRLLFFHLRGLNSQTKMSVTHPKGATRDFVKSVRATRRGINFEAFTIDAINGLLADQTEWDISMNNVSNGRPGNSIKGSSYNRITSVEGEVVENGVNRKGKVVHTLKNTFGKVSELWRGWSVSREKANNIMKMINGRYQQEFFNELSLNQTEKIFLYNIRVDIHVYQSGFDHILNLSKKEASRLFVKHGPFHPFAYIQELHFRDYIKRYKKNMKKGKVERAAKFATGILSMAHKWLGFRGFKEIVGKDNFIVFARVDGFREGDEAGDEAISSNMIGEFGDRYYSGPLDYLRRQIDMTESEFFAYWLMSMP
jgi:hypothetical protein